MKTEVFNAYTELSKEAQSIDDLATLREMALADEGKEADGLTPTTIEVVGEQGEKVEIDVKKIGAGMSLAAVQNIQLAEASHDWHSTEDK